MPGKDRFLYLVQFGQKEALQSDPVKWYDINSQDAEEPGIELKGKYSMDPVCCNENRIPVLLFAGNRPGEKERKRCIK